MKKKRIKGGGKKLKYKDLDSRLLAWFQERRSSTWAPSRGPMGCFTPKDVFNFDESPLALFGDQTKRSINYVNTSDDISGNLPSKVI